MTAPVIADNQPRKVHLQADKDYFFCVCGRSSAQPFCDSSHKGSGLQPKKFRVRETGDYWLCCCKHTGNMPFCDGSHKRFEAADIDGEKGR